MLTAMIIEDNDRDSAELKKILTKLQPEMKFVLCEDGRDAVAILNSSDLIIDLFFVDRQLPGLNGFDLAEQIREMDQYLLTPIIFVTGHAMDQLDAFQEYHAYSYILKPLTEKTVKQRLGPLLENLGKDIRPKMLKKVVELDTQSGAKLFYVQDILGVEVITRKCSIFVGKTMHLLPGYTIETVIREINEPNFVRCHKSFAVNLEQVADIINVRRNLWEPVFYGETPFACQISRTYYEEVVGQYKRYLVERE